MELIDAVTLTNPAFPVTDISKGINQYPKVLEINLLHF